MAKEQLIEMEDGTYKNDLKDSHAVDLMNTFGKHIGFVEGIIGLVLDGINSDKWNAPSGVGWVLSETEKRLDMLRAIGDELGYRAGTQRPEEIEAEQSAEGGRSQ